VKPNATDVCDNNLDDNCDGVVDDGCGQARRARRTGKQPVVDVRYMTRYSAIGSREGWGSRQLEVEVIFPAEHKLHASLRRWVVSDELRTYQNGELLDAKPY